MAQGGGEIVFLQGPRVALRPILLGDVSRIIVWINDPQVTQYLNARFPMMEADENEWVENLHKRKPNNMVFAIVVDGRIIGTMGIHNIDWQSRIATTGALIGERDCWGKGYGSEAKMLLLNYAFNTLNLFKIYSHVVEFNGRSRRYSEKCGYREVARLPKHHFRHGRYWDDIILSVTKKDWAPFWKQFTLEHNLTKEGFLRS